MNPAIKNDFIDIEKKLKCYVDRGRVTGASEVREEPTANVKPNVSLVKSLKRRNDFEGSFMAVDCSTRTIKRANNWGIYLMRPSFAVVENRVVDWVSKSEFALWSEMHILVVTS